jgi:hypothetical protein
VIVAVAREITNVTRPVASTEATFVLLEVHVTVA